MAKVLLLSPPYLDLYGKLNKAAGRYFPLGIGYIAAYLRKYGGHEVRMYEPEAQNLSYEDLSGIIRDYRPDFVGITCSTPNFSRAVDIASIVRKNSDAKIIFGGVHVSALPDFILSKHSEVIDYIVIGEGEVTSLELINCVQSNGDLNTVKGIAYTRNGKVVSTAPRDYIDNLDCVPFPARDLIPQNLFSPNLHNSRHRNCLSILTSRGCPYNCSFCASRIVSGKKYRMHSAEYVLEEMELLKKEYKARQLLITDDTFTVNHERLEKICKGMIDRRLGLQWFCFSQINTVNRDILKLMKEAGCYNIGFGIESADPEILKSMGKAVDLVKALEAVKAANELGIKTQAFYVFGTKNETLDQMNKTIDYYLKLNSTLVFYNMLVPYPGTRDFEQYFADVPLDSIKWGNFVAIGENCVLEKTSVSADVIKKTLAKAYLRYYLSPTRILRILYQIRTPFEFTNYLRAALALFKQTFSWRKRENH